ncbi:MAG: HEPN domain-containing protein [Candidatus Aerophobetes bacterium]|nr:HEPN domain-containing protein [Candidatus Aerophobetes bacterium]
MSKGYLAVSQRKYRAIQDFKKRLLSSPAKNSVAKIILFGSLRKGKARPESDVDLLVFATNFLEEMREACLDASLEINIDLGESVEPLVYSIDSLRHPNSYFLYCNIKNGKEIYTMEEEKLRREEAIAYLELAQEYEKSARDCSSRGHYRLAVDGAYNAVELCAKGFLILKLKDLPTSHGGIVGKFGEIYVRSGILSKEMGREFNRGLWLRNQARYERHTNIGKKESEAMLELVGKFINALDKELYADIPF